MDDAQLKPVGGTKMEREILQQTLDKHRDGIIITQVAAGREFKGQPFSSKPDVIHFKVRSNEISIYSDKPVQITLYNLSNPHPK